MENNKLYTSSEAATILGISANTVRSWLSRYPQVFEVGVHLVEQSGKKVWTEMGLNLLRQRVAENALPFDANNDQISTVPVVVNIAQSDAITTQQKEKTIATDSEIAPPTATPPIAVNEISNETATFNAAIVESFTDKLSLEIAAAIAEQIPGRVLQHINRMLHHNPTLQEREILQHATLQQLQQLPGIEKKYLALPQSK